MKENNNGDSQINLQQLHINKIHWSIDYCIFYDLKINFLHCLGKYNIYQNAKRKKRKERKEGSKEKNYCIYLYID